MLTRLFDQIRANRWLWWAGWFNVALFAVSLVGLLLDTRQVLGINPWIKPIKFEISVLAFVWTMAVLLHHAPAPVKPRRLISLGIFLAMSVEMTVIVGQAARGKLSHFNSDSPLDGALFSLMGFFIMVNTAMAAWTLYLYRKPSNSLSPAVLCGVRLGLVLFLLTSAEGLLLVFNRAHTVGAPDGGPGLPFLNWSTRFGDLRVAHFAGMHGLQLLPLLGLRFSPGLVQAVFAILAAAVFFLTWQALNRIPLLAL
ncbi:MAG: hypothetical protein K2X35_03885 [Bryobacteraceae bacterium]|nr:hypothetical protein [Bryobacteraceae bacterium]